MSALDMGPIYRSRAPGGTNISEIYLVPGSESAIDAHPEIAPIGKFVLPPEDTLKALNADLAVVYDASGSRLRNVTSVYKEMALESFKPGLP